MKSHYWNRLPGGLEVDLSSGQFKNEDRNLVPAGEVRDRDQLFKSKDTLRRYKSFIAPFSAALLRRGLGIIYSGSPRD